MRLWPEELSQNRILYVPSFQNVKCLTSQKKKKIQSKRAVGKAISPLHWNKQQTQAPSRARFSFDLQPPWNSAKPGDSERQEPLQSVYYLSC